MQTCLFSSAAAQQLGVTFEKVVLCVVSMLHNLAWTKQDDCGNDTFELLSADVADIGIFRIFPNRCVTVAVKLYPRLKVK